MKKSLNKILLEAVHRGIKLALDDFDDLELTGQLTLTIKDKNVTKDYFTLMDYVIDLGLPSGTLWCKYNLDCNWDLLNDIVNTHPKDIKPEDWYGNYYMFEPDNEATDAYNMNIKNFKFHIPTKEQFDELRKYTNYKKFEFGYIIPGNGLTGYELTSKINGLKIFFPAAGYSISKLDCVGTVGRYWSSTNYQGNSSNFDDLAYYLGFGKNYIELNHTLQYCHFSIRTVINL